MAEPIINPWFIYFADISRSVEAMCAIFFFIASIVVLFTSLEREQLPSFLMMLLLIIPALIIVLIPPKETFYKMVVAHSVTPEFLLKSGETAEMVATRALDLITDSAIKIIREIKQ